MFMPWWKPSACACSRRNFPEHVHLAIEPVEVTQIDYFPITDPLIIVRILNWYHVCSMMPLAIRL